MADQDKVYHPDDKILCPYNNCEMIPFKRMSYHLIKCRKKHPSSQYYMTCPLNASHVLPYRELVFHLCTCPDNPRVAKYEWCTCPDNARVEQDIARVEQDIAEYANGAEGGQNASPGRSRGRGRGSTPTVGRRATIAEMNGHVPQAIGRGMTCYNGGAPSAVQKSPAAVKPEVLSTTPVLNVGIGRGIPNGISSPPSFVVPTLPQKNGHVKEEEFSDDAEDFGEKLKKIEKKLRQIQLLEERVAEEGYTLSTEEQAKVGQKKQLTGERDNLLEKLE